MNGQGSIPGEAETAIVTGDAAAGAPVMPTEGAPEPAPPPTDGKAKKPRKAKRHRSGLGLRLFVLWVVFVIGFCAYSLSGRPIRMPVFVVAEIEQRVNAAIATAMPKGAVSLGGVDVTVDSNWLPQLRLVDVRVLQAGGQALMTLPDLRLTFDMSDLLVGKIRPKTLRLIGAHVDVRRNADGQFDFALGRGSIGPQIRNFPELFEALNKVFASPVAASLTTVETEGLTLTLDDYRAGRTWEVADGQLKLENAADALTARLSLSLDNGGVRPAQAVVTAVSPKGTDELRVTADVTGVAARDIAAQSPPLAWAGAVDAPISGHFAATLVPAGISAMEATLQFDAGALQPSPQAQPIAFDRAGMALHFDPARGEIVISDLSVQSSTLKVQAVGQSYLTRADGSAITGALAGEMPDSFVTQLQFSQVSVDPEGLFEEPVTFSQGALDLRLRLAPFTVDIGQLSLTEDGRRLTLGGVISADANGWSASVDMALNEISHDRLLALWPMRLVPGTRTWVQKNVLAGDLTNVQAAVRIAPGKEPLLHLGYDFANADAIFLATLPPIKAGYGYASIDGKTYTMVMSKGTVTPPEGGQIDMAGSVFKIGDVTRKPAIADITLSTVSSLTAALSLLDQPPFHFMTKADQPVTLGQGEARIVTQLRLPLQKKIALPDVDYHVQGTVTGFSSDSVVPGRKIVADALDVSADTKGLLISGPGKIGAVPFDVNYSQSFDPAKKGTARIEGTVTLSQATVSEFGLGLPNGMVSGEGQGQIVIDLAKGQPGKLSLVTDLNRIGLAIPELGWSKPAAGLGRLEARVRLGSPPKVEQITLDAAGLKATGSVTMQAGGGLDLARFDRVQMGNWLDAPVELRGRGENKAVGIAVTGGSVDMRKMPGASQRKSSGGSGGGPLDLRLDSLRISSGIALTGFQGKFSLAGSLNGDFVASLNGKTPVKGTVAPSANGSAVRLQSKDAGAALAAAGVFSGARGGTLDLQLLPQPKEGNYDGSVQIRNFRVVDTNVLAEMLNLISVVGLLEQLNGPGLLFAEADGSFVLTPDQVKVQRGSATGASLGVSMDGTYQLGTGSLDLQGVVSPIYMLNGIGAIISKRGEGVLGFNYSLTGTADAPAISVNPLSIFTPGMFRDIFRRPPPVASGSGG